MQSINTVYIVLQNVQLVRGKLYKIQMPMRCSRLNEDLKEFKAFNSLDSEDRCT